MLLTIICPIWRISLSLQSQTESELGIFTTQKKLGMPKCGIVFCLVLLLDGCSTPLKSDRSLVQNESPAPVELPMVLALPNYPLSVQDRPTTDGAAY